MRHCIILILPLSFAGRSRKSAKVEEPTAEPVEEDASKKPQWLTTMPDGSRLANTIDGTKVETRDALVCMATDPNSKQVRGLFVLVFDIKYA